MCYSNLKDSTIRGTGFDPLQATGHLRGPDLLVQVMAFTEIAQPHKRRVFKFQLSDGEFVVDAFACAPHSCALDFDKFRLGCKVSLSATQEPHFFHELHVSSFSSENLCCEMA